MSGIFYRPRDFIVVQMRNFLSFLMATENQHLARKYISMKLNFIRFFLHSCGVCVRRVWALVYAILLSVFVWLHKCCICRIYMFRYIHIFHRKYSTKSDFLCSMLNQRHRYSCFKIQYYMYILGGYNTVVVHVKRKTNDTNPAHNTQTEWNNSTPP